MYWQAAIEEVSFLGLFLPFSMSICHVSHTYADVAEQSEYAGRQDPGGVLR